MNVDYCLLCSCQTIFLQIPFPMLLSRWTSLCKPFLPGCPLTEPAPKTKKDEKKKPADKPADEGKKGNEKKNEDNKNNPPSSKAAAETRKQQPYKKQPTTILEEGNIKFHLPEHEFCVTKHEEGGALVTTSAICRSNFNTYM